MRLFLRSALLRTGHNKESLGDIEANKPLRHQKRSLLKDTTEVICSFCPLSLSALQGGLVGRMYGSYFAELGTSFLLHFNPNLGGYIN
jgi:hypothetical protein